MHTCLCAVGCRRGLVFNTNIPVTTSDYWVTTLMALRFLPLLVCWSDIEYKQVFLLHYFILVVLKKVLFSIQFFFSPSELIVLAVYPSPSPPFFFSRCIETCGKVTSPSHLLILLVVRSYLLVKCWCLAPRVWVLQQFEIKTPKVMVTYQLCCVCFVAYQSDLEVVV